MLAEREHSRRRRQILRKAEKHKKTKDTLENQGVFVSKIFELRVQTLTPCRCSPER